MTAPVLASTYVARRLGVPLAWSPPLITFQARRGVAPEASTTREEPSALAPEIPRVTALGASALVVATELATAGATARSRVLASVWLLPSQAPDLDWCTTRSPPTTSSPW